MESHEQIQDRAALERRISRLKAQNTERNRIQRGILSVVEEVTPKVGEDYFRALVKSVGSILKAKCVMVAERRGDTKDFDVVAIWMDGQFGEPFTYGVAGTPCECVMEAGHAIFPKDVAEQFPHDEWLIEHGFQSYLGMRLSDVDDHVIGHFAVLDDKPIESPVMPRLLLQIFAGRAAVEIDRKRMLAKLEYRLALQQLVSSVSSDFVNLESHEVDGGIQRALGAVGEFCEAHRSFVFLFREDGQRMDNDYEWCASGVKAARAARQLIRPWEEFPEFARVIQKFESIRVPSVSTFNLPTPGAAERLNELGFGCFVVVPMLRGRALRGVIGLEMEDVDREWSEDDVSLLRFVGECFSNALDRKWSEETLRETESRTRAMLEAIPDLILMIDRDGICVDVMPAKGHSYFAGDRSMKGKLLSDIFPGEAAGLFATHLDDVFKTGDGRVFEYVLAGEDNQHEYESRIVLVNETRALALVRDVTHAKQAKDAMLRASRMEATATLAGGVAHDFNNLMASVLGNAVLAREQLGTGHPCSGRLHNIAKAAQHAGELAKELLAFARGGKYQPKVLNLNSVVKDSHVLQEGALGPGVEAVRVLAEDLWHVKADPAQMNQVVMNLAMNAGEATYSAGRVEIRTANVEIGEDSAEFARGVPPGRHVALYVSDTGRGMDETTRSRLFEPFFTTKEQGRGLGLAAVYGIIKNHGGHVLVDSTEGAGSMFTVLLPAVETPAPADRPAVDKPAEGSETILVADDEAMFVDVMREVIEGMGYTLLSAANGKEAIDIAEQHNGDIDLAILDLGMPIMDGPATFRALREFRPRLKVVICSGYGIDTTSQQLLDEGAFSFLQKPILPQDLLAEIRRVLDA